MILSFALLLVSVVSWIPFADKTSTVAASDGVPIHYSVQGKGEPALVFIHCWACDSKLWENQVPVFAKHYRVVTIDLPGHGESGQDRKNWSVEGFAEDVNTVITKLKLKRVVLIGSSMGGPIAVEAARRMPDRVVGIVPVDTLQNVENKLPPQQLAEVMKQLRADYKTAVTGLLNQFFFSANTPVAVKNRIISEVTSRPPELAVRILEGIVAYDAAPALGKIKVPIRAINSDLNPTNLEVNRKYAPQFDAAIIKGTGHYPMLEAPEQFNELLAKVLRDLPAQRK
ncbi:MAG TPA: alpha/beta hydrolase [Pyrinomonadaceae bacterium]|nr:alpha/beta hydrolase [Pyrinomonadaceae bacterium]